MKRLIASLFGKLPRWDRLKHENAQDLVEYALALGLVAIGAVAGMQTLASAINSAFSNVANTLTGNI